jgi:putative tricarboxylic transport membrane protein
MTGQGYYDGDSFRRTALRVNENAGYKQVVRDANDREGKGMKNLDRISGLILLTVGAAIFLKSLSYPFGTFRTPGPGLFPLIASIILLGLSAILTLHAFLSKKDKEDAPIPFFPEKGAPQRILLAVAGMVGYRYLLPVIGFGPSTGIFMLFLIRFLGGYGWKISLFYSAIAAVAFYYLFQVWLKIPMPVPLLRF